VSVLEYYFKITIQIQTDVFHIIVDLIIEDILTLTDLL